jgi:hypothetical protein
MEKNLKNEIWQIMKTNELCYDPQLMMSQYDAFSDDGSEYHITHSIKAIKNKSGEIKIYNASKDYYVEVENINDLKVIKAFILDPGFDFGEQLISEREELKTLFEKLTTQYEKQSQQVAKLLEQNYEFRYQMGNAERLIRGLRDSLLGLIEREDSEQQRIIYKNIVNSISTQHFDE